MRTEELRTMLHERGDQAHDAGAQQRLAAVRGRVGRVRRRRATVAAGVAAAAVVGVLAAVVPSVTEPDAGPAGAPRQLAGHTVPVTEVATGYTYEYVEGVEAEATEGPLRLRLPSSDEPRLVMWASSADSGQLRLHVGGDEGDVVRPAGDFGSYELLEAHTSHRLTLTQPDAGPGDRVALAVFDLADERPAGVTKAGVTYRERILDDSLLGAAIGDRGQAEVTTEVTVPDGELRLSEMCAGKEVSLGTGYEVIVSVDGHDMWGSSCGRYADVDQGGDGSSVTPELRRLGIGPGEVVEVRARLVHMDAKNRPVSGTDAVIGVGAYEKGGETFRAAGWDLPERMEHDGHVWTWAYSGDSQVGQPHCTMAVSAADGPMLLVTATKGLANGSRVGLEVDGERRDSMEYYTGPAAGSWGPDLVLEPGVSHEATLRVRRGLTERTRLALVVYQLEQ